MLQTLRLRARSVVSLGAVAALGLAACSTDRLLSAENPDNIDPSAVATPAGATGLANGSIGQFRTALYRTDTGGEGIYMSGGMLADEWKNGNTFTQTYEIDQRNIRIDNSSVEETYRRVNRARVAAIRAIAALNQYGALTPANTKSDIGRQWVLKGLLELAIAEHFCNGTSLGDASQAESPESIIYSAPMSNVQVTAIAAQSFDSALKVLPASDLTIASSSALGNAARIGKARALVNLKDYAGAAALVTGIPTNYAFTLTFQTSSGSNGIWSLNTNQKRYTLGDSINNGGIIDTNAIPFARLSDARVPATRTGVSFDTNVPFARQNIWGQDSSISIIKGVDARLIEAEAQLDSGRSAAYLTTLNTLRSTTINPATGLAYNLPALVDPVTQAGRVSQFFREKALWQFGRGYRLDDLRRLVRQYGRPQETVFPQGIYFKSGGTQNYGTDVNFPIPQAEENNPEKAANTPTAGCSDRKA